MSPERHGGYRYSGVLPRNSPEIEGFLAGLTARGGSAPCPIPGTTCWAASTYADVARALADEDAFRPWIGDDIGVIAGAAHPVPLPFVDDERHLALRRQTLRS